jgi:hypothetical protein
MQVFKLTIKNFHLSICNVRHDSVEDKPPKCVTSSFWFGCISAKDCVYWVHSYCFGIGNYKADLQKTWEKVKWSCPKHQKNKHFSLYFYLLSR